jgi:hypothetical protein
MEPALAETRARFIRKEIDLNPLQTEQAGFNALDGSIIDLKAMITDLDRQIEQAKADAERDAKLTVAREAAERAKAKYDELSTVCAEINEFLATKGQAYIDAINELRQLQGEYGAAVSRLEPSLRGGVLHLTPGDVPIYEGLKKELARSGAAEDSIRIAGAATLQIPIDDYREVYQLIEVKYRRAGIRPIPQPSNASEWNVVESAPNFQATGGSVPVEDSVQTTSVVGAA